MKHLGDITKLNGATIPVVDCIIGGSPCQDLSVAGKRAGLEGERSGLFMDQIRIVKEMRENDKRNGRSNEFIRPRFMVWENVPGAFSANNGEDFRAVIEETARIADCDAVIPRPPGGWRNAGVVMADGWSIAWRVHDAQFWGVPQRRRRIALVADFGGQSAPEILFERKGMSRDIEKGGTPREGVAAGIEESSVAISFQERAGKQGGGKGILIQGERAGALSTVNNQSVFCIEGNGSRPTHQGKGWDNSGTSYTLNTIDRHAVLYDAFQHHGYRKGETCGTLTADQNNSVRVASVDCRNGTENNIINGTLQAKDSGYSLNCQNTIRCNNFVRRLTPIECERLQGFPDGWTDIGEWTDSKGKVHKESSDSARYKALGNSIALPFWKWLLKRISDQYDRPATMGSLFDGIGGFPLCWEECNGKGSTIWASEIEEFPIAVTKRHFPEDKT